MKFDIKNRFSGSIITSVEIDCDDADGEGYKLGLSVKSALSSGANLSWADLSGADLSGANLSRASLSRANLSGADLSGADLSGANLSGANLSGANLSGADLSRADLSGANLSRAKRAGGITNWWWQAGPQGSRGGIAVVFNIVGLGLRWTVGCRVDCTTERLREAIANDHGTNDYAADYLHLIAMVETHPGLARARATEQAEK